MYNTPSYYNYLCAQPWEFSIEADPGYGCYDVVKSAKIVMTGPSSTVTVAGKKESVPPYMVFGDQPENGFVYNQNYNGYYEGNIIGRDWVEGDYTIDAYFYSKSGAKGNLVSTISASFYVSADSCCNFYFDDTKTRRLGGGTTTADGKGEGENALHVLRGGGGD